jgi:CobQ-like glutamine amidotransferase family enzyme
MITHTLNIVHLYAKEMNIYGDNGNVLALSYRSKSRGITVKIKDCNVGDKLDSDVDIIVAGGGQDRGQLVVQNDIQKRSKELTAALSSGVSCLCVCGTYQLLGHEFITAEGQKISGIGYFDMTTVAKPQRLIGNIVLDTDYGQVVGFENHSGQTFLGTNQQAFGRVSRGHGNNEKDNTEGAILNNTIGTYLHGPILPKNPKITDELINRAIQRKYGKAQILPEHIDDSLELLAFKVAANRP